MVREIRVLDRGWVKLADRMGGDAAVVRAARRCWRSVAEGEASDERLLAHLLKHNHGTPFEHAVFTFDVKCPIFVARQWFRHRIASYNEVSLRYCVAERECFVPDDLDGEALESYRSALDRCFDTYERLVAGGTRREIARAVLPLAIYTEFFWTVNTRSLMNFLGLRLASGAQREIRRYAEALLDILRAEMPVTARCFEESLRADKAKT